MAITNWPSNDQKDCSVEDRQCSACPVQHRSRHGSPEFHNPMPIRIYLDIGCRKDHQSTCYPSQLALQDHGAYDDSTTASSNGLSCAECTPCCIGTDDNMGGYARNDVGSSPSEESSADWLPSVVFASRCREGMSASPPEKVSHRTRTNSRVILGAQCVSSHTRRVTQILLGVCSTKPCHQLQRIPFANRKGRL